MDAELKLLAEASLAVERAESAAGEGAFTGAREALDEAAHRLEDLRRRWATMPAGTRAVVGPTAATVRVRGDALAAKLPRPTALSLAAPEHDPEEDEDPAAAA
jgi:hypothetical protein